jgi:ribonuclease HI
MSETPPLPQVTIYTDGGADPNPGPGGWGAVLIFGDQQRELSGGEAETTNNRMELTAALEALKSLSDSHQIDLYLDSTYVLNGLKRYLSAWKEWGLMPKGIPNDDLWIALVGAASKHQINFNWVRGHTGVEHNERADQLATLAMPVVKPQLDAEAISIYFKMAGPEGANFGTFGWAARIIQPGQEQILTGRKMKATPNHFSLQVILEILTLFAEQDHFQVFCDNSYLYDGAVQWMAGWKKSGWKKPNKFKEDWQVLDDWMSRKQITWIKVKAHDVPTAFDGLKELAQAARDGRHS